MSKLHRLIKSVKLKKSDEKDNLIQFPRPINLGQNDEFAPTPELRDHMADLHQGYPSYDAYLRLNKQGYHEPYAGGYSEPWRFGSIQSEEGVWNNKSIFPVYNVKPQGAIGKFVAVGGADPFSRYEKFYGAADKVLDEHKDKPLKIFTRNAYLNNPRYLDKLSPEHHHVFVHFSSDDDNVGGKLEPHNSEPSKRIDLVHALKLRNIPVTIVHDKIEGMIPEINRYPSWFAMKHNIPVVENHVKASRKMKDFLMSIFGMNIFRR